MFVDITVSSKSVIVDVHKIYYSRTVNRGLLYGIEDEYVKISNFEFILKE
jgi:hypothetical protein